MPSLAQSVQNGSRLALARLITQIENYSPEGRENLNELFPLTGRAHLVGVTGAPGTGKSSLVNQLALQFRRAEPPQSVGIVAVDPSSPFTGGAILGDRVRMRDLAGDPGVYIRSMASRGSLGGLAATTSGVVQALDAAGFEIIMIETIGAGQAEVDIARLAHTTLVVEAPGLGDDIQAIKAGILEIADILVINKADRPGMESTERALKSMLQLGHPVAHIFQNHASGHSDPMGDAGVPSPTNGDSILWIPPILRTVATEGTGVGELRQAILDHRQHLVKTGELKRRDQARLRSEFDLLLREELVNRWRESVQDNLYQEALRSIADRHLSPWQALQELLEG